MCPEPEEKNPPRFSSGLIQTRIQSSIDFFYISFHQSKQEARIFITIFKENKILWMDMIFRMKIFLRARPGKNENDNR